jgi:hypothetical protein
LRRGVAVTTSRDTQRQQRNEAKQAHVQGFCSPRAGGSTVFFIIINVQVREEEARTIGL